MVRYFVPVDEALMASDNIVLDLTLRMIQQGLRAKGLDASQERAQKLYYHVPWNTLPSREEVEMEVGGALGRGESTIFYDSNAVHLALRNEDTYNIGRARAVAEFREELANSTYVEDAFASFYIAHINAPLSLANDAVALAWKGTNTVGITGGPPVQLPKIAYVGEFGQKYGEAMETGAKLGLLAVTATTMVPHAVRPEVRSSSEDRTVDPTAISASCRRRQTGSSGLSVFWRTSDEAARPGQRIVDKKYSKHATKRYDDFASVCSASWLALATPTTHPFIASLSRDRVVKKRPAEPSVGIQ